MRSEQRNCGAMVAVAGLLALAAGACEKEEPGLVQEKPAQVAEKAKGHDDHSGWWCAEHGIPEEICGQCNGKYAAECKKKGDWCQEHDRPDSQCFIHHPELKQKFAALYRTKYGKEPPPTEDESSKEALEKGSK